MSVINLDSQSEFQTLIAENRMLRLESQRLRNQSQRGRCFWFPRILLLSVLSIVVLMMLLLHHTSSQYDPVPKLQAFATSTLNKDNLVDSFLKVPTEYFHEYGDVSCFGPINSTSRARSELHQVMIAPSKVLDEMALHGIRDGFSVSKTFHDTSSDMEQSGSGSYYFAVMETTFDPLSSQYLVCSAVAGIEFRVAEVVVGYNEEKHNEIIGEQDCNCGWFWCAKCPVIQEFTSKRPVFKRYIMPFQEQAKLADWLEQRAAKAVQKSQLNVPYSRIESLLGKV